MNTIAERIFEADKLETLMRLKQKLGSCQKNEREELLRYVAIIGEENLAKELFGVHRLGIIEANMAIVFPDKVPLFIPYVRETGGILMDTLSKKELSFLLQAFFPNIQERNYIIDLVFYRNNFLYKTSTDILDFMNATEELFHKAYTIKKVVLKIVDPHGKNTHSYLNESANDDYYNQKSELFAKEWYEYNQDIHALRLEYMESLFCQTVALLADVKENYLWAMDPKNFSFIIPEKIHDHINLIKSICEFQKILDPHFPELHTMIEASVASWILIYKGFSDQASNIRNSVSHDVEVII